MSSSNSLQIEESEMDYECIELFLRHGAMIESRQLEFLAAATRKHDSALLTMLLHYTTRQDIISAAFKQAFEEGNWGQSSDQLAVMSTLLQFQASGDILNHVLMKAVQNSQLISCRDFTRELLSAGASADHANGFPLQWAAEQLDVELAHRFLQHDPSQRTMSNAFPYVLNSQKDDSLVSEMIDIFLEHHRPPDIDFEHSDLLYPLILAVINYPANLDICHKLMRHGYSPAKEVTWDLSSGFGPESVTMLLWALGGTQNFQDVHDRFIQSMIEYEPKKGMLRFLLSGAMFPEMNRIMYGFTETMKQLRKHNLISVHHWH